MKKVRASYLHYYCDVSACNLRKREMGLVVKLTVFGSLKYKKGK